MPPDRLVTWSHTQNALVPLVRTQHEGGQTILFEFEKDRSMVAGVPVQGQDLAAYWAKIEALIEAKVDSASVAWPVETLVCPRDRRTPKAFAMRKAVGPTLETLLLPAERQALGLRWGKPEFLAIGELLCDLFEFTEREGFTQNDCHPGQYIVRLARWTKRPEAIVRVDTPAFSFWHRQVYFGTDGARWECVPPELQWLGGRPEGLKGYRMTREADRFALGSLLFTMLTGAAPTDYAGGDPDPATRVARKEFAVLSMPQGAKVAPEVERAFYDLPAGVMAALDRALLGDASKRPSPAELRRALSSDPKYVGRKRLPGVVAIQVVAVSAGSRLVRAGRKNALWIAAAASLAGGLWLLPHEVRRRLTPSVPLRLPAAAVRRATDPLDIPLPSRRPARVNSLRVLNRKAAK